eukprot:TRINITY_DN157_c2_g3_i1.p1 TRINITY_DN157_c2_g3~~TRINITY_DN157_c2_g3_i1.p1  ORF type:complete len:1044 (+),score=374.56 TRINITY_DN157_c2_g3_i1:58-3132(+)
MENIFQEVVSKIIQLYSQPEKTKEADRWLEKFFNQKEAWSVADQLLRLNSNDEQSTLYHFYGAKALRKKIESRWSELEASSRASLRDAILQHIITHNSNSKVLTQLCIALALVAIQMEEWGDPFADMIRRFTSPQQGEDLNRLLICLLQFLIVYPEEIDNPRLLITAERRNNCLNIINQHVSEVTKLLGDFFQVAGNNLQIQQKTFSCLLSWLKVSQMIKVASTSEDQQLHNLLLKMILFAFDALALPDLNEISVDVICSSIKASGDLTISDPAKPNSFQLANISQSILLKVIEICDKRVIPLLIKAEAEYEQIKKKNQINLANKLSNEDEDQFEFDDETVGLIGYCRILAEAVESFSQIFAQGSPDATKMVAIILRMVNLSSQEIIENTIWLWFKLVGAIQQRDKALGVSGEGSAKQLYSPAFVQLISSLTDQLQYPSDFRTYSKNDADEFRSYRQHVAEVIRDACLILDKQQVFELAATNFLKKMEFYNNLKQINPQAQDLPWEPIEASIYAMKTIATTIESTPVPNPCLNKLLELFNYLPLNDHVRYVSIQMIGLCGNWLTANPNLLKISFEILLTSFSNNSLIPAITHAIRSICETCHILMAPFFNNILEIFTKLYNQNDYDLRQERSDIAASLAFILTSLPQDQSFNLFRNLVYPPLEECSKYATTIMQTTEADRGALYENCFFIVADKLTMVFSMFKHATTAIPANPSHPCVLILRETWNIIQNIFLVFAESEECADNIIYILKYAIRCCPEQMGSSIEPISNMVTTAFQKYHHSCFLYMMNVFVTEYFNFENFRGVLIKMLGLFSNVTFNIFSQTESFIDYPGVVEEFFELMVRCVRRYPPLLQHQPISFLQSLFTCAVLGLQFSNTDKSVDSILYFFEQLFKLYRADVSSNSNDPNSVAMKAWNELCQILGDRMDNNNNNIGGGYSLISATLIWAIDCLSKRQMSNITSMLQELINCCNPQTVKMWIYSALKREIKEKVMNDAEKQQFVVALVSNIGSDRAIDILSNFQKTYRYNR